jgi:hypothetical protein
MEYFLHMIYTFEMQTNSTTKKAANEIPKENMDALKLTVTNNLLNIQNAQVIEELFDKTYKQLGELCDVDFRTIKRWVTGETKALASGPYEKIRNFIDLIEIFHISNPIELFAWARRTDVTHVIFEYKWGNKSVKESKPFWDLAQKDITEIMTGYKLEQHVKEITDLLVEYEEKSEEIYERWLLNDLVICGAVIPPFSLPEELMDPDQQYKVAVFHLSTDGPPELVYKPNWDKVVRL